MDICTRIYGTVSTHGNADWLPAIHNALFAVRGDCAALLPIRAGREGVAALIRHIGGALGGLCIDMALGKTALALTDENDALALRMGLIDTISVSDTGARIGHLLLPRALQAELYAAGYTGGRALILGSDAMAACAARALIDAGWNVSICAGDSIAWRDMKKVAAADGAHMLVHGGEVRGAYDVVIKACDESGISTDANMVCDMYIDLDGHGVDTSLMRAMRSAGAYAVSGFDIRARWAELAQKEWGFAPLGRAARMDALGQVRECACSCA